MTTLNTIIEEEKLEPQVDYILYNLRQSIKHELEGTNIGAYKNDVQKYKTELLNVTTTAMQRAYEAGLTHQKQSIMNMCEEMAKEYYKSVNIHPDSNDIARFKIETLSDLKERVSKL